MVCKTLKGQSNKLYTRDGRKNPLKSLKRKAKKNLSYKQE